MPDIGITVTNRIAQASGKPEIVCGNSDYTAAFTFDSEWNALTEKTLQLAYYKNGTFLAQEVAFSGTSVELPPLYGITEVFVGVYAGNIRTTTPARIACLPCITDLAYSDGGSADPGSIAQIVARLGGLSFLKLTAAEYAALDVKDANTAYFVTDTADFTIYLGDLPLSGGGGGGGGTVAPVMQLAWSVPAVKSSRLASLSFEPSGAWKCDLAYYIEGTPAANVGGRSFRKISAVPAIGCVGCTNVPGYGYLSALILLSDNPDGVVIDPGGYPQQSYKKTVQYGGITWYVGSIAYAMGGDYSDANGIYPKAEGILSYDSTAGDCISDEDVIAILQAANAQATS